MLSKRMTKRMLEMARCFLIEGYSDDETADKFGCDLQVVRSAVLACSETDDLPTDILVARNIHDIKRLQLDVSSLTKQLEELQVFLGRATEVVVAEQH